MFKRTFFVLGALALSLSACQPSSDPSQYNGSNAARQKNCDQILSQLGVSGDEVLSPEVGTTPERKRLVGLYSAYGCDK